MTDSVTNTTAVVSAAELFEFAASGGRLMAELETNDEHARNHPLLVHLANWLEQSEELHRVNMQDGTGSGLLSHLSDTWGWTTDHAAIGAEFRGLLGQQPGSSLDIGRAVDAEIGALVLGVTLATPPHSYTCKLLKFLRARKWLPLATQVPLWHRGHSIYTFIDLLVYDVERKELILVELKTGFDHAYDTPISDLHRDCDVFVDTPRLRHQQQLCWMQIVLEAELAPWPLHTAPLRGCIVRVSAAAGAREPDWSEQPIRDYFTQTYICNDPAYAATVQTKPE